MAQPGERYTFQIGVVASGAVVQPVKVTAVTFTAWQCGGGAGPVLPADAVSCMNLNGTDFWGYVSLPFFSIWIEVSALFSCSYRAPTAGLARPRATAIVCCLSCLSNSVL